MIPKVNAVVPELTARASEATLGIPVPARTERSASVGFFQPLAAWVARLRDAQLAWLIGAILFASTAWLVALTEVPPMQDLPNHLATITVIRNPALYPEFVFNGFFKTNAALFTWLYFVGNAVGLKLAARLFTLVVLAANALVLPQMVLAMTGSRRKLVVASLFMWPMIHNWFVSMGMLDFALGVPLALLTLTLVEKLRQASAGAKAPWAVAVAVAAVVTWYAHVFTLMVVGLLVTIEAARQPTWRARFDMARALLPPLVPASALVAWSLWSHLTEPNGAMHGWVDVLHRIATWELAYNMWAEYLWGFTKLSITSIVPAIVLGVIAIRRRKESPRFFSPAALIALSALYVLLPYVATNWFHVNSRVIPFLWAAMLVRVPDRLPRALTAMLLVSAVLYVAGMGIDYVRLDRDRQKFVAGMSAVPEHAHLMPLLFSQKVTSENTRSLLHAWGWYVVEKKTDAPLLFAHSRSFPVMYRDPPPPRFNHLVLESFAPSMASPGWMCGTLRAGGVIVDCEKAWRDAWEAFWRDVLPRYDHVLMWDPPPEVMTLVPPAYRVKLRRDQLVILERIDGHVAMR